MPETPQYLLGRNRRRDAEKVLRWLRGPNAELSGELEDMQKEVIGVLHSNILLNMHHLDPNGSLM